jgi:hypothetical protein
MPLEYIPLLDKQRELYTIPMGMERFREYLKTVVGDATGHDLDSRSKILSSMKRDGKRIFDLELPPLISINPMAKEHALKYVEALLALGAEDVAREAVREAEGRLEVIQPHLDLEHYPTQFACLFGDEAAKAVGYPPLGLSARAGFAVALEKAIS